MDKTRNAITRRGFFRSLAAAAVGVAVPDKQNKTVEYERLGDYAKLTVWEGGNVTIPWTAPVNDLNMHGGTLTVD